MIDIPDGVDVHVRRDGRERMVEIEAIHVDAAGVTHCSIDRHLSPFGDADAEVQALIDELLGMCPVLQGVGECATPTSATI